ncbi:Alpha-1,2-mannosidase [Fulvivirga imtechensis AK7]|uniref:Alpha-1,2-mannosidase n=1 Tax=Fulvivirga imtechensis AK7 TaxID=1237149 RepID=L8JT45_9BACT|nr:GH92 family glycosyl hydrolase [Fulvivirga imtechensis]ELR72146.1 Alpha-1,2-mannosidase [Fulvivirga imtechensis AK7]
MTKYFTILPFLIYCSSAFAQDYTQFVNPFIGTSNYGATHPGAVLPAGMASVSPFNVAYKKGDGNVFEKDSEWHSRTYVHENNFLTGYSHVNLSGVGCPDLGSILLMPTTGKLELDPEKYGSTYRLEQASPGYYSNHLTKYNIKTEVSATMRTGISRYTFPAGESHILLNLGLGLTNETGAALKIVSHTEIEGYKLIGTFCYNPEDVRPVYFVAKFSRPADKFGAWKKMPEYTAEAAWTTYNNIYKPYNGYSYEMAGENIGTYFSFQTREGEAIEVKIGISYVSIANARENLEKEQPAFSFDQTAAKAKSVWNSLLKRIEVQGGTDDEKTIFYTALYHILLHPNIFQDVNGDYPLMESSGIGKTNGNRYTVFSLWDTYRNLHPFLSLVYPELQSDMINSMLSMYKESGWLPKWELLGMETNVMVGDPATPVLVDSWLRGIKDFDIDQAYEAMKKAAITTDGNKLRPGIEKYSTLGYIPEGAYDNLWGTVSTTLEYNISDWNLAQLARELGKNDDYKYFNKRALSYRNYFDKFSGMLRPRMSDGSWLTPFDPKAGANFEPVVGFVEGNAWQYRFYVPHDINGMIKLVGGSKKFVNELQRCFDEGNYDMANEPDITYPFLFNYVKGEEWRSQLKVRELIGKHYSNTPSGIPGNDDTGTLSAWLVYSMLGIYPHCPGDMSYALVSPVFDKVTIHLNQKYYPGERLVIQTEKNKPGDVIIEKVKLNGAPYNGYFIDHQNLINGSELLFKLKGH